MGTESGFTGYRSLIRIQCGLAWTSHGTQTTHIALLDRILRTIPVGALSHNTAGSSDPDWGCVEAKWSLDPDSQSSMDQDPRSCVESRFVLPFNQMCLKSLERSKGCIFEMFKFLKQWSYNCNYCASKMVVWFLWNLTLTSAFRFIGNKTILHNALVRWLF